MADRERRVMTLPVEGRAGETGERRLSGYAALYGVEATIGGFFREVIEPGAFRAALARKDDVRALFNHDPNLILGRTAAGTVTLSEDERGLRYDIDLPDTQFGRDLWTLVGRGDVSQSSFAFSVDTEDWPTVRSGELPLRVVRDLTLYDVSAVTYPAYSETTVAARSQAAALRAEAADWRASLATRQAELATVDAWRRGRC